MAQVHLRGVRKSYEKLEVIHGIDMLGSLVYAGGLGLNEAYAAIDKDGVAVGDELRRIGYLGAAKPGALKPHAFVELHIEQGPILDEEKVRIGVVESVQGISWTEYSVTGVSNHVTDRAGQQDRQRAEQQQGGEELGRQSPSCRTVEGGRRDDGHRAYFTRGAGRALALNCRGTGAAGRARRRHGSGSAPIVNLFRKRRA